MERSQREREREREKESHQKRATNGGQMRGDYYFRGRTCHRWRICSWASWKSGPLRGEKTEREREREGRGEGRDLCA